jgi:hypothetical protein
MLTFKLIGHGSSDGTDLPRRAPEAAHPPAAIMRMIETHDVEAAIMIVETATMTAEITVDNEGPLTKFHNSLVS